MEVSADLREQVAVEIRPGVYRPDWSAVTKPRAREALAGRMAERAGLLDRWSHRLEADEDTVWRTILRLYGASGRSPSFGKPGGGKGETGRLITQEKVPAVFGASFSSVTAASSQAAERAGIPFVNAESSQPALTQRGLKYFFRTSPTDETFSQLMFDFLKDFGAKSGQKFESVSIFHEDTAYGTDSAKVQEKLAKERGLRLLEKIAYKAQTTSLTAEVQRLKAANADVLLPPSYTSDTFLLLRTAKDLDYNPKLIDAKNDGFTDQTFIR